MRFASRWLGDDELRRRGFKRDDPKLEWYTHLTGANWSWEGAYSSKDGNDDTDQD